MLAAGSPKTGTPQLNVPVFRQIVRFGSASAPMPLLPALLFFVPL